MGLVEASWSVPIAQGTSRFWKASHRFHSGRMAAVAFSSMKLANASLSQAPSHHAIVTRLPNHWWAISCPMTSREF
jgi:hypothetical protein